MIFYYIFFGKAELLGIIISDRLRLHLLQIFKILVIMCSNNVEMIV